MGRILSYAGKDKKYVYIAVAALFISVAAGIIPFIFMNGIVNNLIDGNIDLAEIFKFVAYIFIALSIKSIFLGVGLELSHIGAFNIITNMRNTFLKDMARQPMGHILDEGTGKYKKTFVEDISVVESTLAHIVPEGIPNLFVVLLTIIVIFIVDYRIGLVVLVMVPVSMLPMGYIMKVGTSKLPMYYESRDNLNHTLVEYVSGMEVVKVFNKATKSFDKIVKTASDSKAFTLEFSRGAWKATSVLYSLLPCTLLVPLPLGVYLYLDGSLTLSSLTLIIMLCLSLGLPLIRLINFMPSIPVAKHNIEKIEAVFKYPDVKSGNFEEKIDKLNIKFNDVVFAYVEKNVLEKVNFEIKEKTVCALVGPSGGGKSTIAKLLMHFWDIKDGSIEIGDKNINEFTFNNLMNHISYVSQENTLFAGTIFENIVLDNKDITEKEVIDICKKAKCHDFINELPKGYQTEVGLLGNKLSGGERQRITIARAMLKNAPIIVLDEATSFADAENEFLIQEALSSLLVGKTVLLIAHKLHTITDVDKIIVIKDGQVDQTGTHGELLKSSKTYQTLWEQNEKSVNWNLGGESNV